MEHYQIEHTTNIEVFPAYRFKIDGEDIEMYEEPSYMGLKLLSSWNFYLQHLNPVFEKPETWVYSVGVYCDYAEFYIRQQGWNSISVCTQFYDESDKIERICDAKTFYKKIIEETERFFSTVEITTLDKTSLEKLSEWKAELEKIKAFYQKYYV
jgi:hypothetical protein